MLKPHHRVVPQEPVPGHHRDDLRHPRWSVGDAVHPSRRDPRPLRRPGHHLHRVPGQAPQVVEDQITYPVSSKMLSVPFAKVVRGYSFFGFSVSST